MLCLLLHFDMQWNLVTLAHHLFPYNCYKYSVKCKNATSVIVLSSVTQGVVQSGFSIGLYLYDQLIIDLTVDFL